MQPKQILDLLQSIEWAGPEVKMPTHRIAATCPSCKEPQPAGHAPLCHLRAGIVTSLAEFLVAPAPVAAPATEGSKPPVVDPVADPVAGEG